MRRIIKAVAEREGETPQAVRAEMQKALAAAWADPKSRETIIRLSGRYTRPTPEQFIALVSGLVSRRLGS